jgi:hypothetical protein
MSLECTVCGTPEATATAAGAYRVCHDCNGKWGKRCREIREARKALLATGVTWGLPPWPSFPDWAKGWRIRWRDEAERLEGQGVECLRVAA